MTYFGESSHWIPSHIETKGTQEEEVVAPTILEGNGLKGGKWPLGMTALGASLQKRVFPSLSSKKEYASRGENTPGCPSPYAHVTGWPRSWNEDHPQSPFEVRVSKGPTERSH